MFVTYCGAKTRRGTACQQPAMRNGRCRLHGGKTPRGLASPHLKHGRYSQDWLAVLVFCYWGAWTR
jgi:hypothetical protein